MFKIITFIIYFFILLFSGNIKDAKMKYCLVLICLILPVHSNICCSPVQYETKEGLLTGSVNDMGDAAATYVCDNSK